MTETANHVMNRTMELKKRNKVVCYPSLSDADFGGTNLNLVEKFFRDIKFDEAKKKECNTRDYNEKLKRCETKTKEELANA